jgi:hypothetical protein
MCRNEKSDTLKARKPESGEMVKNDGVSTREEFEEEEKTRRREGGKIRGRGRAPPLSSTEYGREQAGRQAGTTAGIPPYICRISAAYLPYDGG